MFGKSSPPKPELGTSTTTYAQSFLQRMQTKEDKSPSPKSATTFKSHPKPDEMKVSMFDTTKPADAKPDEKKPTIFDTAKPTDVKLNASEPEIS